MLIQRSLVISAYLYCQAFNNTAQRDTRASVELAKTSTRDSATMKVIAFVTVIFLPATFVSVSPLPISVPFIPVILHAPVLMANFFCCFTKLGLTHLIHRPYSVPTSLSHLKAQMLVPPVTCRFRRISGSIGLSQYPSQSSAR